MLLFNRYEYNPQSDLIGKGGFSRVYKALDKKLNRLVALKVYKTSDIAEKYSPIAEIQRVISLDHPNIARYLDIEENEKENAFGEVEKIQVCVVEFLDGGNLSQYYHSFKDVDIFKKLVIDVLNGLNYLHENGIIHRDIKPGNILIKNTAKGPVAKITDFGISKRSDSAYNSTSSALIVSIPYMAPEQLNPRKYGIDESIGYNIDLWSLGVAIYEILAGQMLFKNDSHESSEQIMTNILQAGIPDKINLLAQPFRDFVSKCLVKDAKNRVKQADELIPILTNNSKSTVVSNPMETSNEYPVDEKKLNTNTNKESIDQLPDSSDTLFLQKMHLPVESEKQEDDVTSVVNRIAITESNVADNADGETHTLFLRKDPDQGDEDTLIIYKDYLPHKGEAKSGSSKSETTDNLPDPLVPSNPGKEKPVNLFNRYDYFPVTDLIGKGGFSRVYKAYDKKLNRWVALKIYKTGEFSDRYSPIAEIRRVVNLDHPNICRYLDIEEIEKENPFGENEITQICVMELLDSGNLAEFYKKNKNPDIFKKLLHDILNGLAYLHRHGIIHRDIKPQNILIKSSLEGPIAKITDFGISKAPDNLSSNSTSAMVVSIPYMAPEQLNIRKYGINDKISYNLDLWSLGVTVYEIITGKVLFKNHEEDSSEQIMTNIMASGIPEKINELPDPFRQIVSLCIVKNARERVQKAEELLKYTETEGAAVVPHQLLSVSPPKTPNEVKKQKAFFVDETVPESRKEKAVIKTIPTTKPDIADKDSRQLRRKNIWNYLSSKLIVLILVLIAIPAVIIWHPWGYGNTTENNVPILTRSDTAKKNDPAKKGQHQDSTEENNDDKKVANTDSISTPVKKKAEPTKPKTEKENQDITNNKPTEIPSENGSINVRIKSSKACIVTITIPDDIPVEVRLAAGSMSDVPLLPGTYQATVVSVDNSSEKKTFKLVVEKNKTGKSGYRIPWEKF